MSLSKDVVLIKPNAYRTMLLHVLRWGSTSLSKKNWKECMGLCYGKIEKDQVVVYEAVPMTHGKRVEVEYNETDYAKVELLENKYMDQGLFVVGWYHSHPGMGPFLSAVDIKNHFSWQQGNPKSIAIVFDHTFLEDGMGFEVFRLNDISLREKSDFHGVKFEVEPPDSLDYFKMLKLLVEDIQKGDPIMKEEGETVDFFEGVSLDTAQKPESGDLKEYVVNNTTMVLQTFRKLMQSMTTGVSRLQNWFRDELQTGLAKPLGDLEIEFWDLNERIKNTLKLDELEAKQAEEAEKEDASSETEGSKDD